MNSVLLCLALLLPGQDPIMDLPVLRQSETAAPQHEPGVALTTEQETQLAFADYEAQPEDTRGYVRYLSLRTVDPRAALPHAKALAFMIPSASREVNLDGQIPQRLMTEVEVDGKKTLKPTDLYRINLLDLGWGFTEWTAALKNYPYGYTDNPIIVRGDWLVHELSDLARSKTYYNLLYGEANVPKTATEMYAFFKVRTDQQDKLGFGLVVQDSPVAISKERLLEHTEVDGGYAWQTFDVFEIKDGEGPLDKPKPGLLVYDGTELIIGIPKVSVRNRSRGALQVYQLGGGNRDPDAVPTARVEEAPGRLVNDYVRFKGHHVIVNVGSCIQCHAKGINEPQVNGLEKALVDGVELNAQYNEKQFFERFHLTDVGKEIRRNQEDYAEAVKACNGTDPATNAALYKAAIDTYWADLTPEQVAREVDSTVEELTLAIAYASEKKLDVGVRFSGLAHGRKVTRPTMESGYLKLREILNLWRQKPS